MSNLIAVLTLAAFVGLAAWHPMAPVFAILGLTGVMGILALGIKLKMRSAATDDLFHLQAQWPQLTPVGSVGVGWRKLEGLLEDGLFVTVERWQELGVQIRAELRFAEVDVTFVTPQVAEAFAVGSLFELQLDDGTLVARSADTYAVAQLVAIVEGVARLFKRAAGMPEPARLALVAQRHGDAAVRREAAERLFRAHPEAPETRQVCAIARNAADPWIRLAAFEGCTEPSEAVDGALAIATNGTWPNTLRARAARVVGAELERGAVPTGKVWYVVKRLEKLLTRSHGSLRGAIHLALDQAGERLSMEEIWQLFESSDRRGKAGLMALIGHRDRGALEELLAAPDWQVSVAAMEELGRSGGLEAIPALSEYADAALRSKRRDAAEAAIASIRSRHGAAGRDGALAIVEPHSAAGGLTVGARAGEGQLSVGPT